MKRERDTHTQTNRETERQGESLCVCLPVSVCSRRGREQVILEYSSINNRVS